MFEFMYSSLLKQTIALCRCFYEKKIAFLVVRPVTKHVKFWLFLHQAEMWQAWHLAKNMENQKNAFRGS